jgi:signal transduction histidine kinase
LVTALAVLVAAWLTVDAARQNSMGIATTEVWFTVIAAYLALTAAVLIGRSQDQRRMGILVVWWVATNVGGDVATLWPASRWATTLLLVALALQAPAYAHMTLAYPTGHVRDRLERRFLILAYVVSVAWELPPALFVGASACRVCTPRAASLVFTGYTFDIRPLGQAFWTLFIVLGVGFLALILRRSRHAPPGAWRTLFPLAVAGAFATVQLIVQRMTWLANWSAPQSALDWLGNASLLIVPTAFLVGAVAIRRDRGAVGDLVVELAVARPTEVRSALARAVGDPSLDLALWLPERNAFVDELGHSVQVEHDDPSRTTMLIGSPDDPVAIIIHDAALTGQRPLLEAAGSAARLALENARLQADLRAQLDELRASRSRIVEAADVERRRLERDLHDGAQQRLLALGLALQLLGDNGTDSQLLTDAQAELAAALQELRELARGIHPAVLTERGLATAVNTLADRTPIAVSVDVPSQRFPENVESAAYFVVSESLANIVKHAHATRAAVTVTSTSRDVVVEVRDNGRGGAATRVGGGLEGLADRVGAIGGRLLVTSTERGTTIRAELPCES